MLVTSLVPFLWTLIFHTNKPRSCIYLWQAVGRHCPTLVPLRVLVWFSGLKLRGSHG
jgi:hypothetical protein